MILPEKLLEAFSKLAESGKAIGDTPLIVGGFVRDWVAGLTIDDVHDFDVICEKGNVIALVNDMCQRFGLGKPQKYGFTGTYRLMIDGYVFEFQDPQNPNVHFPIQDELARMGINQTLLNKNIFERDFTIDCLCFDVINHHIVDVTGKGVEDLTVNKAIRTPINPRKAIEFNPIILIRMIRLMIEFDLEPVPELEAEIPYGITLLPQAAEKRSERFLKKLVTEVFNIDPQKASELFTKYGLWGNVPMSKHILDTKVKSDMGIVYQAMSVTLDQNNNKVTFGMFKEDILDDGFRVAFKKAIAELYLNKKIFPDTVISFLEEESCKVSEMKSVLFSNQEIRTSQKQYPGNPVNSYDLFERYQRRHDYRQRKRREQKRDRVGKIQSWRDFRNQYGGGK